MSILATAIGLTVCGVLSYFALLLIGTEERFALPYAVFSAVLAAVFVIHLVQIKSSVVTEPRAVIPFALGGVAITGLSLFSDCVIGVVHSPQSLLDLSCLQSSGGWAVLSLILGWVWLGATVAALVRSILLGVFRARV